MVVKKFVMMRMLLLVLFVFIFAGCSGESGFLGSLFGTSGIAVGSYDRPGGYDDEDPNNVVPEPSTMVLLGSGMAAAYFMKKKDKNDS